MRIGCFVPDLKKSNATVEEGSLQPQRDRQRKHPRSRRDAAADSRSFGIAASLNFPHGLTKFVAGSPDLILSLHTRIRNSSKETLRARMVDFSDTTTCSTRLPAPLSSEARPAIRSTVAYSDAIVSMSSEGSTHDAIEHFVDPRKDDCLHPRDLLWQVVQDVTAVLSEPNLPRA